MTKKESLPWETNQEFEPFDPSFIDLHFELPKVKPQENWKQEYLLTRTIQEQYGEHYEEDQPRDVHTGHGLIITVHLKHKGAHR